MAQTAITWNLQIILYLYHVWLQVLIFSFNFYLPCWVENDCKKQSLNNNLLNQWQQNIWHFDFRQSLELYELSFLSSIHYVSGRKLWRETPACSRDVRFLYPRIKDFSINKLRVGRNKTPIQKCYSRGSGILELEKLRICYSSSYSYGRGGWEWKLGNRSRNLF